MNPPFRLIEVRGSPSECGKAYGEACRDQITTAIDFYSDLVSRVPGYGLYDVERKLATWVHATMTHFPDAFAELCAIAYGANVIPHDVMLLNARSELLSPLWGTECTSIGVSGNRTACGEPLVAQTWDWLPAAKAFSVVLKVTPTKGPTRLTFCEAGQLAKIGINSDGMALGINFLPVPKDCKELGKHGVPVHLLCRMVLGQNSMDDVYSLASTIPPAGAIHLLVADVWPAGAGSEVVGFEIRPGRFQALAAQSGNSGLLTHANDFEYDSNCSSSVRGKNARFMLESIATTKIHYADLEQVLSLHTPGEGRICYHETPGVAFQTATLAAVILEPQSGAMRVAEGPPCKNEFYHYTL